MRFQGDGNDLHPGLNNEFQKATMSELALTYNDQSVLENFHAALRSSLFAAMRFFSTPFRTQAEEARDAGDMGQDATRGRRRGKGHWRDARDIPDGGRAKHRQHQNDCLKLAEEACSIVQWIEETGSAELPHGQAALERINFINFVVQPYFSILASNARHRFHKSCITTWMVASLAINNGVPRCPLCRKNIDVDRPVQGGSRRDVLDLSLQELTAVERLLEDVRFAVLEQRSVISSHVESQAVESGSNSPSTAQLRAAQLRALMLEDRVAELRSAVYELQSRLSLL
ncbi:hypothetical protein AK812_SmicGene41054 [Symbiodinium microadriaticum]|uniref:PDEase domain-containing protein n=1 Tax=Symbiodinium microadriaticum TaxID=2951 RepID=A0A1Q9C742_SYMMI|nr:hypothetical protein AK812_SmicGene41054 [Symbiodinium microadriaticum]